MTLLELLKLLRRDWRLVVALPVALAVVCAAVMLVMPAKHEAIAVVSTTGEAAAIGGIAESAAAGESAGDVAVTIATNATKKQIVITASGTNPETCVALANKVTKSIVYDAERMYPNVVCQATDATAAADISPSVPKYALVALLAGLFLAVCAVVLKDMILQPIKSSEEATELTGLPVFGHVSAIEGNFALKKLAANIGFAADGVNSFCLVPADDSVPVEALCETLVSAMREEGLSVRVVDSPSREKALEQMEESRKERTLVLVPARPLSESEDGVYLAHASGSTLLVLREWATSRPAMEETIRELALASASVVGLVVFASRKTTCRRGRSFESSEKGLNQ